MAVAALKLRLPKCPPGRADTDVKRWYRTTVETLKANRLFHILRLCGIELKDMDNKEFSDIALVSQALYDCLSSDGERRRLREELGSDADNACAQLFTLAQSGVRDSDLQEKKKRDKLKAALNVQFAESSVEGTARKLLDRWESLSIKCATHMDDAALCLALSDAVPEVLREPWRVHLTRVKLANPTKAAEYDNYPSVLASELDLFFKDRRDRAADLLGRKVLPAELKSKPEPDGLNQLSSDASKRACVLEAEADAEAIWAG